MNISLTKYVYEFIGTFFLVLTVGMTVLSPHDSALWAPIAIGLVLAAMIFAGGYVSGGHYNPAVSLMAFLRGKLSSLDLMQYWVAQLVAGVLAAWTVMYLKGEHTSAPLQLDPMKALLAEFLFTFALCYTVSNVAMSKGTAGNSFYGLAIGLVVLCGAYAVGPVSGAAFNPAVAVGISVLKLSHWSNLWIYLVGNLLGGAAAAFLCNETEKAIDHQKR